MLLFPSQCGLVRDWPELNPYIMLPDTKEVAMGGGWGRSRVEMERKSGFGEEISAFYLVWKTSLMIINSWAEVWCGYDSRPGGVYSIWFNKKFSNYAGKHCQALKYWP